MQSQLTFDIRSRLFEINQIRHGNTQQRYLCAGLFSTGHEKLTDKLSVRQQSIYCVKNARNALSQKHCSIWPTFSRHFEYLISFQNFSTALFYIITTITSSVFQQICSFIHKDNVSLKINANNPLVCLLF